MRQNSTRRNRYPALVALGAVAVFTACSGDEQNPLTGNPAGADLAIGVEVSQASAQAGQQIAVAVRADGREVLGGLQGTLRYDASKLAYVGQGVEGGKVTIVNSSKPGEVRLVSFQGGTGIAGRSGTLVFAVKGSNYAQSLKFALEMATDLNGAKEITKYKSASTAEAANLVVTAGAKPMAMADWNEAIAPTLWAAENRPKTNAPGTYLASLHYGNANLSAENAASCTSVNVLDATYVANVAAGNNSVQGVDFPTRDPVIAGNVSPNSLPIPGISGGGARSIDVLDAQAVANEAVGNDRPVVCDLIPGREPVTGFIATLSGSISTSRTLFRDTLYKVSGVVKVNGGATLTIQPGTRIEGIYTGSAVGNVTGLIIERDGLIDAQGTLLQPIVFSCDQTPKFKGCWGGLVIAGNAIVNASQAATATSPIIAGRAATANCNQVVSEGTLGTPAEYRFGGCNDTDNSGTLRYAIVEYGGFSFAANRELNNLTVAGVGSGTTIEFVQVHAGLDDGYEIWGGSFNTRNILITANSDDGFDFASGWRGKAQFLIIQSDSLDGDKGFEIDNTESSATYNDASATSPGTTPEVYNTTMIGKADPAGTGGPVAANNVEAGIHLRRGAHPRIFNTLIAGWPFAVRLDNDVATAGANAPNSTCLGATNMNTLDTLRTNRAQNFTTLDDPNITAGTCTPYPAGTSIEDDWYLDVTNANDTVSRATALLIAPYNVVTPDFRPVSATAVRQGAVTAPPAGFFDPTANYVGAVAPLSSGGIPWYSGWSRQWTTATTP